MACVVQFLKERERDSDGDNVPREWQRRPSHSRTLSTPAARRNSRQDQGERAPLLRRRRSFDQADTVPQEEAAAGGTVLGIHNLAIVMPQFIVGTLTYISKGFTPDSAM